MKPISLHVADDEYRSFKTLAERTGRPVAELIREAMAEYLDRRGKRKGSIFDLPPHPSGPLLAPWTRDELLDEMRGR
jgi:ribbon-helix-helix CopG family protein